MRTQTDPQPLSLISLVWDSSEKESESYDIWKFVKYNYKNKLTVSIKVCTNEIRNSSLIPKTSFTSYGLNIEIQSVFHPTPFKEKKKNLIFGKLQIQWIIAPSEFLHLLHELENAWFILESGSWLHVLPVSYPKQQRHRAPAYEDSSLSSLSGRPRR